MKQPFLTIVVSLLLCLGSESMAQSPQLVIPRTPRTSQGAQVTQVIGMSSVTITYHRPGVKGRMIWGPKGSKALLPYGEVWRAGANEPTLFTFSDDVTINGKPLKAGTYRFAVIPENRLWTIIFNTETGGSGAVYHQEQDVFRLNVRPASGPNEEWLSYSIEDLTPTSARVVLAWQRVRISFTVQFNLLEKLQASVGNWNVLNSAARFAVDNGIYLVEATSWINRSIALDKNPTNLRTKAELLAKRGQMPEAIRTAEEALAMVMKSTGLSGANRQQAAALRQLINEFRTRR